MGASKHHKQSYGPKNKKKNTIIISSVVAVLVIALFGGWLVRSGAFKDSRTKLIEQATQEAQTDAMTLEDAEHVIDGVTYTYNTDLVNYLFLGIDTREIVETDLGRGDAGQSDAIFLVSYNKKTGDTSILSIPRDTMTQITVYSHDGNNLGQTEHHLSIQYGYGDGRTWSGWLTADAVSKLLGDIPIEGFVALNLDGLGPMMDYVGDISVTVPNDSLLYKDETLTAGSELVLNADNIELFVRSRDVEVSQTAIERMERQETFIDAFIRRVTELYSKDQSSVSGLYDALSDYMNTNLFTDELGEMAKCIAGGSVTRYVLPGEGERGKYHDEFHVDEKGLISLANEIFYVEE